MDSSKLLELLARALARVELSMPMPSRLCRACVEILGAQSGTLTLGAKPDERLTVSTSDGMSADIEDLEDVLGEGPGRLALTEDRIVAAHIDTDDRTSGSFPVFSSLVGAITGPAELFAVPMHVGGRVVGVLSLSFDAAGPQRAQDDMQFLADAVGLALINELDSLDWSTRSRIHRATGMVTAQLRIPPDDALAVMRAHAFAGSTTLEAVADDIVERRITFTRGESDVVETERTEEP